MTRDEARTLVIEVGVVPVIRVSSPRHAIAAAEAVHAGGIPIVEITMTVPGAVELIRELSQRVGKDVLVGAGTVLNVAAAQQCLDAGAEFLVSPGFDPRVVELAQRQDKLVIAGALTPTEVIAAWSAGSDFVKVFPCSAVGGPKYIQSLRAPLPQVPLIATGGISLSTAADYIRAGAMALGVSGELGSTAALESGGATRITDSARLYVAAVREARAEVEAVLARVEPSSRGEVYERQ
jgi:2-dehydro-3-deoxyphosphogluconate aldolase / (4S)-4-hydroxy-2-oxoglutarate aldolase